MKAMKNSNIDVVMDMFLDGELPQDEMIEMQHAIETEKEVKEVYELHLNMQKTLRNRSYSDYRNLLEDVYTKNYTTTKTDYTLLYRKYIPLAAVILIFLSIGTIVVMNNTRMTTSEKIYAEFYETNEFPGHYRSSSNKTDISIAIENYEKGAFLQAFELAQKAIKTKNNVVESFFVAGLCQHELGNNIDAIFYLDKVLNSDLLAFKEKAEWYKALFLLQDDKIEKSKILFSKMKKHRQLQS
jgi:tetratricopeptide (TPR) repeat protein